MLALSLLPCAFLQCRHPQPVSVKFVALKMGVSALVSCAACSAPLYDAWCVSFQACVIYLWPRLLLGLRLLSASTLRPLVGLAWALLWLPKLACRLSSPR